MSTEAAEALRRFLSEDCTECGTPGYQRHLSAVNGCATCAAADPRPVNVPLRNTGIAVFDAVLPKWPRGELWTPFRDRLPRATSCYQTASGAMVHVKPECRCLKL